MLNFVRRVVSHYGVRKLLSAQLMFQICYSLSLNDVSPTSMRISEWRGQQSKLQTLGALSFVRTTQLIPDCSQRGAERRRSCNCGLASRQPRVSPARQAKMAASDALARQLRDEFPALKQMVHNDKPLVYLDRSHTLEIRRMPNQHCEKTFLHFPLCSACCGAPITSQLVPTHAYKISASAAAVL